MNARVEIDFFLKKNSPGHSISNSPPPLSFTVYCIYIATIDIYISIIDTCS